MYKKMSLLIFGIFSCSFVVSLALAEFDDVSPFHPNADAIEYVRSENIVEGYDDGSYRPDQTINRAEFVKIIMEVAMDEEISGSDCFPDVKDEWFARYVCAAKALGIVGGYPDGTFGPGMQISFVEASKIIINSANMSVPADAIWYKPYVEILAARNAIPKSINDFSKNITRGEMAEMVYRLRAVIVDKESKTYEQLAGIEEEMEGDAKGVVGKEGEEKEKGDGEEGQEEEGKGEGAEWELILDIDEDEVVAMASDTKGEVTFTKGSLTIPVQIIDEISGEPIPNLSLAVGLHPEIPGTAMLFIADSEGRYPFQFVVLESPRSVEVGNFFQYFSASMLYSPDSLVAASPMTNPCYSKQGNIKVPIRSGKDAFATAVKNAICTDALGSLPPPDPNASNLAKLFLLTTQKLRESDLFLPGPLSGGVIPKVIEQSKPMPIGQMHDELRKEASEALVKNYATWLISLAVTPASVLAPIVLLTSAAQELTPTAIRAGAVSVYERLGVKQVVIQKIRFGGILIVIPVPVESGAPKKPLFPAKPNLTINIMTSDKQPVSDCSVELISESIFGLAILTNKSDSRGQVITPMAEGDYKIQVICRGFDPVAGGITISSTEQVVLDVVLQRYKKAALFVGLDGTGQGRIRSLPAGIDCESDCSEIYDKGVRVILVATPYKGSFFSRWTGDCTSIIDNECTINSLKIDTAIVAVFTREAEEVVPDPDPDSGSGSDPGDSSSDLAVSVSTASCQVRSQDAYSKTVQIVGNGSATGPVGTTLVVGGYIVGDSVNCGSWTNTSSSYILECTRSSGQPETTNWSFTSGDMIMGPQYTQVKDFAVSVGHVGFMEEDSKGLSCP